MTDFVDNVNDAETERAFLIAEEIHALRHLFNAARYRGVGDADHRLSHMEGRVIYFLAEHPGGKQSELVGYLGRDKAQVARLVGTLRESGIVASSPDPRDKRQQCLTLTDHGRKVLAEAKQERLRVARMAVAGFSEDERLKLAEMLERIRANLQE